VGKKGQTGINMSQAGFVTRCRESKSVGVGLCGFRMALCDYTIEVLCHLNGICHSSVQSACYSCEQVLSQ
jgi:hypothetical protein